LTDRRSALKALVLGAIPSLASLPTLGVANVQKPEKPAQPGPDDEVVDRWFGVRADGKTNDREALQKAVDSSVGKTLVITGPCRLDPEGVFLRSHSRLRFTDNASLKLLPHDADNYGILRIWDVQHVFLDHPRVDGAKSLNAAKGGEWGMGISIAGASDVTILSPRTVDCWGDGIYISNSFKPNGQAWSSDIKVTKHYASGCRRQGVSIISAKNVLFDHPVWENIEGTAPAAGLDIEPNTNTDVIENIRIVDPITRNCQVGILVWLEQLPGVQDKRVTVTIDGHRDEGSREAAFSVSGLKTKGRIVTGTIVSNSPTWVRPGREAFANEDYDRNGPHVDVSNPRIIR
jgi:hypothetical protein